MSNKSLTRIVVIAAVIVLGLYIGYDSYHRLSDGTSETSREFTVKGRIEGFGADRTSVIISHEDIPGYMQAMTMPFPVRDTTALSSLHTGENIRFRLHVTSENDWISDIHPLADSSFHIKPENSVLKEVASSGGGPRLHVGDQVPDITLLNQDSTKIHLADFRGKVLVITFFYTSCPLPSYCPLMSKNFKEADKTLVKTYGGKVHLLSVSFDTRHDTPSVLKKYGLRYDADFRYWSFASGTDKEIAKLTSAFDVFYRRDGRLITHNLRTVVIDPSGKIRRIFSGNSWKPQQLVKEVSDVLTIS